tara:strand:+ start:310 stop:906 length:597 start_codon:yes stop_codon:yes gene_type:complete
MAKYVRVTTPVGNASYPWLKQPDTKFNPDGLYSCNIIVDKDKAKKLITIIDKAYDDNIASEKAKAPNKKIKLAAKPYDEQEGNKVLFKIKTKAKIGDVAIRPHVVDAKGQPIINTDIFGGSEVKVSADLIPYYVPANGAGISLRLIGVQILKLQSRAMPSMDSLGFKEEDGYVHTEEEQLVAKEETDNVEPSQQEDFV